MAKAVTLQTQAGDDGDYAFDCYLRLDLPNRQLELHPKKGEDDVAVWRYWYEDKNARLGRWVSLADNVDDKLFLGVEPGITGEGVLVVTNDGSKNDTLWHFERSRGIVALKTQIDGQLNDCYLAVNPDNGDFNFRAKWHESVSWWGREVSL